MTVRIKGTVLTRGDALDPQDSDVLTQFGTLKVGAPLPENEGWVILDGNSRFSEVARVLSRYAAGW